MELAAQSLAPSRRVAAAYAEGLRLYDAAAPFAAGGVYVNFMPEDESDRVENAYGVNYRRLAEINRRYDPDNGSA